MGDRAVVRAMHFYNDCRRAAQLCDAVREDDFKTFLRLIIEGGHSSFEFNQNAYSIKNPKEQGVPVALALSQRVLNGRGAWRLQGGGFAGTIQAFVPVDLLDAYKVCHRRLLRRRQLPRPEHPQLRCRARDAGYVSAYIKECK